MQNPRPLKSALQVLVGSVVLILLVRTWVVMGLVQPIQVAGNSMAPALRGEHLSVTCPECNSSILFAVDFVAPSTSATCPHCGHQSVSLADAPLHAGEGLVVDRFSTSIGQPSRGDLVVLHDPTDDGKLCVKRVLGLPGEAVGVRWGDVWIDGQPVAKSLSQQRGVRQLVHQETATQRRWQTPSGDDWQWHEGHWQIDCLEKRPTQWLRYEHPQGQPITDEFYYNLGLTRQLNLVRDVMLTAKVQATGEGSLLLRVSEEQTACLVEIQPAAGQASLQMDDAVVDERPLPRKLASRLAGAGALLELSNFDGQILLALDGQALLKSPWPRQTAPPGNSQPVSIGASNLRVSLSELCLYRDLYYSSQAAGLAAVTENLVLQLGPKQYYLLGDNSPISIDSRSWGPVPEGLIVGRPLAPGF